VTELNTLLNAGNSPSALARQFVRYLRNALMARVGGENTDLLQISADERARAARSAMLFSEEDLTRFLQVMLRTFDDLNYRQEQRFHLELGLVKLVHLQRLLPVEELLSSAQATGQGTGYRVQGTGGAGAGLGTGQRAPNTTVPVAGQVRAAAPVARPSPFEADRERKAVDGGSGSAVAATRALSPAETVGRAAAEAKPVAAVGLAEPITEATEGSLALASAAEPAPAVSPDLDQIREAVCAALANEGHETAANLIHQGVWSEQGNAIQVALAVRKAMLALTVNAEAEAICRKTMRAMGATQKIAFVPGENGNGAGRMGQAGAAAPTEGPVPIAGSAQSAALENPLVKKTKELFNADIRSVLDLRDKN
jgi:DNA polymerase-3 subunit gamma/tau